MRGPNHIVLRSPNWIGDHILALAFYRSLRAHYPAARFTLLHPPALTDLTYPEIFEQSLVLAPEERRTWTGLLALGRKLRAQHFDLAIVLPATVRAALPFFLARIPARVGFAGDGSDLFLTGALRWRGVGAGKHKSELYQELGDFLSAARVLPAAVAPGPREKRIVIAPGASIKLREWPYQQALVAALRRELSDYQITFIGTEAQAEYAEWVSALGDSAVESRIGATSLPEVLALCRTAAVVVANDSGIAHLAATLAGAPTVVLFGPGAPHYVTPHGVKVAVVRDPLLACSPCEKPYCRAPYGYQACLKRVSPEAVLSAIRRFL